MLNLDFLQTEILRTIGHNKGVAIGPLETVAGLWLWRRSQDDGLIERIERTGGVLIRAKSDRPYL